jgi:hypothetical protein
MRHLCLDKGLDCKLPTGVTHLNGVSENGQSKPTAWLR